jgi:hypothetical protein
MSSNKPGYVYVLENESFPGLVKIGMTTQKNVESRVRQISTGVPTPFHIAYQAKVNDPATIEKAIHKKFDEFRFSKNREWFEISVDSVIDLIWKLDDAVRYRDSLFSGISEYLEIKKEYELKSAKILGRALIILLIIFFIYYVVIAKSDIFSAIMATFGIGMMSVVYGGMILIPVVNRFLYKKQILNQRTVVAEKYNVKAADLDEYKDMYFQNKHKENRRAYLKMKRQTKK